MYCISIDFLPFAVLSNMSLHRIFLVVVALAALAQDGRAQTRDVRSAPQSDTLRLSIEEAVTRAVRLSDETKLSAAQLELTEAQIVTARAAGFPQLRLNGAYTQVIENARLSGILSMKNETRSAKVYFNLGTIVDAQAEKETGEKAFQLLVEITGGTFEFHKTEDQYPVEIQASSNTNLILDTLRQLDESKL